MDLNSIEPLWQKFSRFPGGRRLFSRLLGRFVPYTGTIPFIVDELKSGECSVRLRDKKKIRNHLSSIHAIALANLAEVTSGLALNYRLPKGCIAILISFQIEYLKKARGDVIAYSQFEAPTMPEEKDCLLPVTIRNAGGDIVANARAVWRVGPIKAKKTP